MLSSRADSVSVSEEDEDEEETKMTKFGHIFYMTKFGMRVRREQISFISAVCSDVFWIILARTHDTHFIASLKNHYYRV